MDAPNLQSGLRSNLLEGLPSLPAIVTRASQVARCRKFCTRGHPGDAGVSRDRVRPRVGDRCLRFAEFIISVCRGDHVAHTRFYNRGRVGQTAIEADALVNILETP